MTVIAPVLESFFTQRLMTQQRVSTNTTASYRDTFKLLLGYAHQRTGKLSGQLDFVERVRRLLDGDPLAIPQAPRQFSLLCFQQCLVFVQLSLAHNPPPIVRFYEVL